MTEMSVSCTNANESEVAIGAALGTIRSSGTSNPRRRRLGRFTMGGRRFPLPKKHLRSPVRKLKSNMRRFTCCYVTCAINNFTDPNTTHVAASSMVLRIYRDIIIAPLACGMEGRRANCLRRCYEP